MEKNLLKQARCARFSQSTVGLEATVKTADHLLLERLLDKAGRLWPQSRGLFKRRALPRQSAELLPPLEAMRLRAVDRDLLAQLGDPPKVHGSALSRVALGPTSPACISGEMLLS